MFGDRFCGLETLDKTLSLPDGTKLLEVTSEVREHAFRTLEEKRGEHDGELAVWMDRVMNGASMPKKLSKKEQVQWLKDNSALHPDEFKNWMWVYHPAAEMRIDLEDPTKRGPITISNLRGIDNQLVNRPNGSSKYIRYIWDQLLNEPWLNTPVTPGWTLMTKDFVPNTQRKTMAQQRVLVEAFARAHGFDMPDSLEHLLSPSPIDLVMNGLSARINGLPYLQGWSYERTVQRTATGSFAFVGFVDANGAYVHALDDAADSLIAVSVFR